MYGLNYLEGLKTRTPTRYAYGSYLAHVHAHSTQHKAKMNQYFLSIRSLACATEGHALLVLPSL